MASQVPGMVVIGCKEYGLSDVILSHRAIQLPVTRVNYSQSIQILRGTHV